MLIRMYLTHWFQLLSIFAMIIVLGHTLLQSSLIPPLQYWNNQEKNLLEPFYGDGETKACIFMKSTKHN